MPRRVGVVDYGAGNLFSVQRGLKMAGCEAVFLAEPETLKDVDVLVLPGVGAFAAGMEMIRAKALDVAIRDFVALGRPLMGVCLGMQFLLSRSQEFGEHDGLGLIPGSVVPIPVAPGWPVPNTGWSEISLARDPAGTPFAYVKNGMDFYFVHSLHCVPDDPAAVLADFSFAGKPVTAIISHGNVHGCQFHPEISGRQGLDVYGILPQLG